MSAFLLAVLIFVLACGLLFWAEQRVPSGITGVMMATIPVFMALSHAVSLARVAQGSFGMFPCGN